ncbi:hypothetical protein COCC4DRAFT_69037 [Bipolaris maydis ATCC 48331]|uniref:Aminotransferase class I/classII large domain-containing protein n=2 Tax=Cochliobolus heterostrophus TaxID=5016 RepID=M2SXZ2_COCH5|nr:uncharacterized protein COCC4DRAFT_69037 [Bipolaris maydis ATCC 48331]EMD90250.1 hypothetical protein COCHEDRAFT_1107121 [Bipolaris maydis C5]KAJ5023899.1 pyridoxal phosphate-dependent transferase [Bipolaris maydis]ENI09536.1 hypothetical protein COCC4DRAFT_69037 [Bipolaris maydis ATCC 48331]KAJ5058146.1 pyridoxal phosphate-dependent transferase [Bipolaris maydis]KAJ6195394.1 pyridoxal phosphate-dependent transferase [Bipolaris maydis]
MNKERLTPLEQTLQTHLTTRLHNSTLRTLTLPLPQQTDFSSNDFLSLSTSRTLRTQFLSHVGRHPLGSGGSRLLDGNSSVASVLEATIAGFHGAAAGLLFNSGFDANAGFFGAVPQKGDVVVYDDKVHASVHDGMRLSRAARKLPFAHNSVEALRRVLRAERESERAGHVFIAVESVYSMDGDVAPLREIVQVADEVLGRGRAYVVVDEAHATGVLGPRGRGLVSELGLEGRVFARLHTFGKALAGNGAILLGSQTLRHYLINYARPLIYTTFLSYPSLALIQASYEMLMSGQSEKLQAKLHDLIRMLYERLEDLQKTSSHARRILKIPSVCPRSPIFAVQLVNPKALASSLQEQGMMVRAVVSPTIPAGTERVRICLHAGNTVEEIEKLVLALKRWCESQAEEKTEHQPLDAFKRARL